MLRRFDALAGYILFGVGLGRDDLVMLLTFFVLVRYS